MNSKILLADEPTGNLDSKSGAVVLDLLDRMNDDGLTLVAVTHDARVARRAERVVVLVDGRVHMRVSGEEIGDIVPLLVDEELEPEGLEREESGPGDSDRRDPDPDDPDREDAG